MKLLLKITLILCSLILIFIIGLFIYVHFERIGLQSVIIQNGNRINLDSLTYIRIDLERGLLIDDQFSEYDNWDSDIVKACSKRRNDSIVVLQYEKSVSQSFIDQVLLTIKKDGKKVVVKKMDQVHK